MGRTLNRKALAEMLDKDPAQLTRWTAAGMPHDLVAGVKLYDASECRAWIQSNVRERSVRAEPTAAPSPLPTSAIEPEPVRELSPQEIELLDVLENPQASSIDRAAAGFRLAGLAVANAYRAGQVSPQQLESLKKQGEELRKSEDAYLALAQKRGELIERATAKMVAGQIAQRLVQLLSNLENTLATQIEIWRDDPGFNTQPTDTRQRLVRAWFEDQAKNFRRLSADDFEQMIQLEETDRIS